MKLSPYKIGGEATVCRELKIEELWEAVHEVKHTAAFHASPSHHHLKHYFLLRTSFMNVLRSILHYSLVARLSATVRLQGKAEESWRSDRNHESHFDIRACHLRRSLGNHWRITKFSINASCKHSTRFVAFSCRDLGLNGALLSFPPEWVAAVGSFTELLDYKLRPLCVVELPFSTVFFGKVLPLYLSGSLLANCLPPCLLYF
jgi:hypothetical protein